MTVLIIENVAVLILEKVAAPRATKQVKLVGLAERFSHTYLWRNGASRHCSQQKIWPELSQTHSVGIARRGPARARAQQPV